MPSPHFDVDAISRNNKNKPNAIASGKWYSAVQAAAYISGSRIYDSYHKELAKWQHRDDVAHSEILAPKGTPEHLLDRETLWNTAEHMEKRKNPMIARTVVMGMPHEISHEERVELLRGYVQENFVSQGMIADIAIHKPDVEKGMDARHHHAHVILTTRKVSDTGFYTTKTASWNNPKNATKWRKSWADHQNQAFECKGLVLQVDERTLKPKHEMVYGQEHFPPQYQFELKPEVPFGKKGNPQYRQRLKQNQAIIDGNMETIDALQDRADTRLDKIDSIKARIKKQERKERRARRARDTEFEKIGETFSHIKAASRHHQRLRRIARMAENHYQLTIYLHGFKDALAKRRHHIHKLENSLSRIDELGNKIERFFNHLEEREVEQDRMDAMDPKKPPKIKKSKKLRVTDTKMDKAKHQRGRKRRGPF